jgi:hypothetical protein
LRFQKKCFLTAGAATVGGEKKSFQQRIPAVAVAGPKGSYGHGKGRIFGEGGIFFVTG